MKIKLVSYFVDGGNQKQLILRKKCEELDREYCKLRGYDIQFKYYTPKEMEDFYGTCTHKEMVAWRVHFINQQLAKNDCDYLAVLDADATISNPNIKIEDLIDDTHEFFLSRGNDKVYQINCLVNIANKLNQIFERERTEHYLTKNYYDQVIMNQYDMFRDFERLSLGYLFNNEGFIIIKNTPIMKEFWKECEEVELKYFMDSDPKSGIFPDGRSFMFLLHQKKYKSLYAFMPEIAQGGVANSFETNYNVDKTFALHNYGQALNIDQKIERVQSLKNNKWWKEILKENNYNNTVIK